MRIRRAILLVLTAACVHAQSWTQAATPLRPTLRTGTRMAFHKPTSKAVLFGGKAVEKLNDTWLWDGTAWTKASPTTAPSARFDHAMAFDEQRSEIVMFGGTGDSVDNTTWVWNGSNWIVRTPAHSLTARFGHAMEWDPVRKQVLLFGGGTPANNETWAWDGADWTRLTPANSPPARTGHSMAWDSARQAIVLYGGVNMRDTWIWSGTNWSNATPVSDWPTTGDGYVLVSHGGLVVRIRDTSDVWNGTVWQTLITSGADLPPYAHAVAAYDSDRQRTLLFESYATSTWLLDTGKLCLFADPLSTGLSLSAAGSSGIAFTVPAPAGCAWTAASGTPEMIYLDSASSGTGPGTIYVGVYPNSSPLPRTGTVRVGAGRTYTVSQASGPCPANGSPLPRSPFTLPVTCGRSFTITATKGEQFALRRVGQIVPFSQDGFTSIGLQINGPAPSQTVLAHNATETTTQVTYLPASGVVSFPPTAHMTCSSILAALGTTWTASISCGPVTLVCPRWSPPATLCR